MPPVELIRVPTHVWTQCPESDHLVKVCICIDGLSLHQVVAIEAQDSLEAATRILLTAEHASEGMAPRLRCIEHIHLAWRISEAALDRALQAPTLTSGKHLQ